MTQTSRVLYVSKATTWAFFTYAPLISLVFNLVVLPGHVILFPYYLIVMLIRGKAPRFLTKWVRFNSHGLFLVKTLEGEDCRSFWCLYHIFGGFIISFVFWTIAISFISLIIPIFVVIEEWKFITNLIYRLSFGYWGKIVNELPGTASEDSKEEPSVKTKKVTEDVIDEKPKGKKKKISSCPNCGVELKSEDTTFCPKCGSLIES